MWNPKTSKTWSFVGSYQGWAPFPPPTTSTETCSPESVCAAAFETSEPRSLEQVGCDPGFLTEKKSLASCLLARTAEAQPVVAAGHGEHALIQTPGKPQLAPNFGANPSNPSLLASAASMNLPFLPSGNTAAAYSCFPMQPDIRQPKPPLLHVQSPSHVTDENATPQNSISSAILGDPLPFSPVKRSGDSFSFRELLNVTDAPPSPPKATLKETTNISTAICSHADQKASIWTLTAAEADVQSIALSSAEPKLGAIGELLLAESAGVAAARPESRRDDGRHGARIVAPWTAFEGDSVLAPIPNDGSGVGSASTKGEGCEAFEEAGASAHMQGKYGFTLREEPPSDLPSPMPPKPKLAPTVSAGDNDTSWQTVTRTCDKVVARAISHVVLSFGGGAVEQGRIGNALSKEDTLRSYIKDKHGSLINFFLSDEASRWFNVTAGVNGCYYVEVKRS